MMDIYIDGSCKGNPGPGGWAAYVVKDKETFVVKGAKEATTNNEMELTALLEGLRYVLETFASEPITIITDSDYIFRNVTRISQWHKNGWRLSDGRRVKHFRLWNEYRKLATGKLITWKKVRAHGNSKGNNIADKLANEAVKSLMEKEI